MALKLRDDPDRFYDEQSKIRYAISRSKGTTFIQLQPYCDEVMGNVKLNCLARLLNKVQSVVGDNDIQAAAKRELDK